MAAPIVTTNPLKRTQSQTQLMTLCLEIVPERVLVLFRPGTALFWFGLGTFFVPEPDLAKHR